MNVLNDNLRITKTIFNFIKLKSIPGLLMIHVTSTADLLYLSIYMYILLILSLLEQNFTIPI